MAENKEKEVIIEATENGPYLVKVNGNVTCALCRCGASKDKPYCDGSHNEINFKAERKEIKI